MIKADNLIDVRDALKGQSVECKSCRWVLNLASAKMVLKSKTDDGDYMFFTGIWVGVMDTIMGIQAVTSEYALNPFRACQRIGVCAIFPFMRSCSIY